jgi:hypothetical protein
MPQTALPLGWETVAYTRNLVELVLRHVTFVIYYRLAFLCYRVDMMTLLSILVLVPSRSSTRATEFSVDKRRSLGRHCLLRPPLWSSGQSSWLQIQRSRIRFRALPDFLRSSGSGTGSTQPREYN